MGDFADFAILLLTTHVSLRVHSRLRGSQAVYQEAGGGRSDRFRARMHAPSGSGGPGNNLGRFHFLIENHDIS